MTQKTVINCNKCGAECDASRRLWREEGRTREPIDLCQVHGDEHQRYLASPMLSISVLELENADLHESTRVLAGECERKAARILELELLLAPAPLAVENLEVPAGTLVMNTPAPSRGPFNPEPLAKPQEPPAVIEPPAVEPPPPAPTEPLQPAAAPVVALQDTPPAPPVV